MRNVCLHKIYELAQHDRRVVFIGSDITRRGLEQFAAELPEQFLVEGIYEAHLIGMAAGLALSGKIPYVNTLAAFLTRRCYEQNLLDVGLHKLLVRLIASGGGAVYAPLGPTHLTVEDFAILRAIPNMAIIAPCDADEMARLMPLTLTWPGPLYIRMAKGGEKFVSRAEQPVAIGSAIRLREGNDVLFITTGVTAQIALAAAERLEKQSIAAGVLHVHTIKPLDQQSILAAARQARAIITVEEHSLIGGLGSAVIETLVDSASPHTWRIKRVGFPDRFLDDLGSQEQIMQKYGITADNLEQIALKIQG